MIFYDPTLDKKGGSLNEKKTEARSRRTELEGWLGM